MSHIMARVKSLLAKKKRKKKGAIDREPVTQRELEKCGLRGITLRGYQLDGVQWLSQCLQSQQGCILGDEMGLGKTCQTISLLVYMLGALGSDGPFLVMSPLSVLEYWKEELERLAPSLIVMVYTGGKKSRAKIQKATKTEDFHVLLTTYELCLKDASFLKRWDWRVLVVDEAHRLKNHNSLLHSILTKFSVDFRILLTGTPIQNNLQEIYSLLTFIQPSIFIAKEIDLFVQTYSNVQHHPALAARLQFILEPFLLRRVKSEVAVELPKKTELLMYHGMSALQKKCYRAFLLKDLGAFENKEKGKRNRLMNILMNLRKCVDHPYLFNGLEPEPFEMGEHLIQASGKLCLLDSMLAFLHTGGHQILLFSQMTRMLDILQDYLEYRGYSYERLDGSIRGEERNLAVKNFNGKEVFIFLLSTKAGGVGLNLTAADTVIFMDSDFNPQNDLQAAARCHRIGQHRPVKVIRLLARHTVEELMYSRAVSKLHLTTAVIEDGRFSLLEQVQSDPAGLELSEIVKFGVDKLLSTEESSVEEVTLLKKILGPTLNGMWVDDEDSTALKEDEEEEDCSAFDLDGQNHMYYYEGKDYSRPTNPSAEDLRRFARLMRQHKAEYERAAEQGRALRARTEALPPTRKRTLRSEDKQETAAKRARIQEDKKRRAWWESCGYRSLCLQSVDSEEEEDEEDDGSLCSTDSDSTAIHYVLGDVAHPHAAQGDAIIVHCVDDSGWWGRGGLFTALELRSDEPRKQYELAGKMKDLDIGNVLLFPIDDKQSRLDGQDQLALIVSQQRNKANNLSGIRLTALDEGLKKIYAAAKRNKASVHLPRIGHSTKGFNWYGTEQLIRKHLASRGIPTFIYYHSSASKKTATPQPSTSATSTSTSCPEPQLCNPNRLTSETEADTPGPSAPVGSPGPTDLPSFMSGVQVFFYNLPASERKRLARYLFTYDGDEADMMSPEVTHIVAEVENSIHSKELQDLVRQYTQALPVQKAWLDSCFSKQRRVNTEQFTHLLK
ncbi:chromodomain-helicase-DNA-binding protein 1-like [Limanda limanda]|uniref:chromodomain-helicase-DNA-binding protein 1-like n=1 Tax=Limanda limanda TaxID=27771 RepID=UPI0029C6E8D8|nr:chromodomain-helicase-DNA-binding protein 1-like [Limanda limanda]